MRPLTRAARVIEGNPGPASHLHDQRPSHGAFDEQTRHQVLLRCRLRTNFASCFSSPWLKTFASTIPLTSSSIEPRHNRSMICRTARAARLRDGSVAWYTYARPLASCRRYPFSSSRRSNVRTVVSLTSWLRDTTWWTASTEQGAASQTACITSFSNSVSGARTRAPTRVRNVMVRLVPHL